MKRQEDYLEKIANLDLEREARCGKPEAVFAERKSVEELIYIVDEYLRHGKPVLLTRLNERQIKALRDRYSAVEINEIAKAAIVGNVEREIAGRVAILTAGTSDIPVAEEAAMTARFMGMDTLKFYDVGVAGLHRIIEPVKAIRGSDVDSVIVVAGMEGALPSVIASLVEVPVIAVPTSVGYGVNLGGISTLFAMLQSCSSGVAVVNIDNGFGAAIFAYLISRVKHKALNKD
jgi:hypothetical protein